MIPDTRTATPCFSFLFFFKTCKDRRLIIILVTRTITTALHIGAPRDHTAVISDLMRFGSLFCFFPFSFLFLSSYPIFQHCIVRLSAVIIYGPREGQTPFITSLISLVQMKFPLWRCMVGYGLHCLVFFFFFSLLLMGGHTEKKRGFYCFSLIMDVIGPGSETACV